MAEPTYKVETKIIREFEENGETKVQETRPSVIIHGTDVEINDKRFDLQAPAVKNETAQKIFNLMLEAAAQHAGAVMSQWKSGEPLQMNLEIPNLKQKFSIEVTPTVLDK